jgi:hypothetical protein
MIMLSGSEQGATMANRELIDKKEFQQVYLSYYDRTVNILRKHERSSFPSVGTTGWPERVSQHSLTAATTKEYISYRPIYKDEKLYGMATQPDQYILPSPSDRERLKQRAMNKAIAKFMDGKQQLGADFAERQSTISMVGGRVIQAYKVLKLVKSGKLGKAVKMLKGGKEPTSKKIAKLRLEFAYGWAPLVGSIYDLSSREFPPDPELYISEKVTTPFNSTSGTRTTDGSIRAGCSFLAVMNSPFVSSAEKLGLTNPASIAWEVVPFSFVVDWFIPISSYIQSLTAFSGYTIKDKCLSYTERLYCQNIGRDGIGRPKTLKSLSRSVHIDLVMRPFPKNPFSVAHVLNALALIRALRKD